jgi:AcrR family transcriptional regulator
VVTAAPAPAPRRRSDAARNAGRIVTAAREVFLELGTDASLDEVARRAGVGVATLYRHFASKEALYQAIVALRFVETIDPVLVRARQDADPWRAVVEVLSAALELAAGERPILVAGRGRGLLGDDLRSRFMASFTQLVRRAQRAGVIRADLDAADLPRLVMMLIGTVWLPEDPARGWQRYLSLMLDALRPAAATPLPGGATLPGDAAGGPAAEMQAG